MAFEFERRQSRKEYQELKSGQKLLGLFYASIIVVVWGVSSIIELFHSVGG